MEIDGRHVEFSHRDKVFFPEAGLSKGDLIDYYLAVAETMLPHVKGHPVSLERFPDGIEGKGFFNKDTPEHFPDWIETVTFPRREGGSFHAPVIESRAALAYLADQAVLTPHLYLAPVGNLECPDRMIFDLDPPEGTRDFAAVRRAALDLHELLDEPGLAAWVQTSGSKGFHLLVPLDGKRDFDEVRDFARQTARLLVRRDPKRYTLEQRKEKRGCKVFLDVLRNSYGTTSVAPYAVRAKPGAPVATPLEWSEVERGAEPQGWTLESVPRRLTQKEDPWAKLAKHAFSLEKPWKKLKALLEDTPPAEEED
ncbi:non-homologous end-joining DNA ligase [Vreelandella massiliensis]|uniref:non-homologous end-joining DNA ligase n=1 Tax=Vreelandella massiliensis TaxID=1816686 RepID=UPI00096A9F26|nr:non-homologous end-joining DNA ligase [Halomonas massiliensis]